MTLKPIIFLALAIVALAALWLVFNPQRTELDAPVRSKAAGVNAPSAMTPPADTPPQISERVFQWVVKGGQLVSGPPVLKVHEGEQVTLHISSDDNDELRLHGYDLHAQISPGETASLQFTANRTGRFGLELHKAHAELGSVEVYPR